ncbi:hypothetical protein TrLO_g1461 [Triparma laevis f. longispina]|uniref:WW domain-containing protein n=1 Tax=Triparma laevis f. longispina TaxID=1714387 RepID=A0A9W7B2G8_9STRA|nr:hypothetical protein TrLO_g1461 [Triparma laevis f. longispina]
MFEKQSSLLGSFMNSKKDDGKKKKGTSAADNRRLQYQKSSSVMSSFSGNKDVWIEHMCEDGEHEGETYFHQPSTGKTVWERPGEGEEIQFA